MSAPDVGLFFAIRMIGTNCYLPQQLNKKRQGGGGYTHTEPESIFTHVPRLFLSETAAKIALTYWLKGEGKVTYSTYPGTDTLWDPTEEAGVEFEPKADRKREAFEIVPLHIRGWAK